MKNKVGMQILFCSPFLNLPGHIRRVTALRSRSMAQAGLDVTVFGFPLSFDEIESNERLRYVSVQAGLSARCRDRLAVWSRLFGDFWLFLVEVGWVQWAALRYARQHCMDVMYIADVEPWLLIPALWLTRSRRTSPRVVGFISFLFHFKTSRQRAPWFTRLRYHLNSRASLLLPLRIDVMSDCKYIVAPCVKVRPDSVHVIMEGYECPRLDGFEKCRARQELGIPSDKKMLLHFGVVTPGKGTELLIEALHGISPSFELFIVGKSLIYSREGLLDGLPAEWREHMHFVERYVSEGERVAYFSACDAVVLPYRLGFPGTGGNFRDAISFGKAILASDQFLMGEMVRKYDLGILFKPEDVNDLRRVLLEFTQKPDTWFQGITDRSKAVVAEFSWDKIGLQYRELFERLMTDDRRQMTDDRLRVGCGPWAEG